MKRFAMSFDLDGSKLPIELTLAAIFIPSEEKNLVLANKAGRAAETVIERFFRVRSF